VTWQKKAGQESITFILDVPRMFLLIGIIGDDDEDRVGQKAGAFPSLCSLVYSDCIHFAGVNSLTHIYTIN
jgi:hypothetical protein